MGRDHKTVSKERLDVSRLNPNLPRIIFWILKRLYVLGQREGYIGDVEEEYYEKVESLGKRRADAWIRRHALAAIPRIFIHNLCWGIVMFKSYLRVAASVIRKQKMFSVIKISGLSIGFAFCILIALFIKDELLFDRFHTNADALYNVVTTNHYYQITSRVTPSPMGEELAARFSEIENFVRINRSQHTVRYEDRLFRETVHIVDPHFFEVFSFPLLRGSEKTVLENPNAIVLTEQAADKYFGNEDPLGQTLLFSSGEGWKPFTVSGLCRDVPANSSLTFDFVISIDNLPTAGDWNRDNTRTYILLKEGVGVDHIEKSILDVVKPFRRDYYERLGRRGSLVNEGETITYSLQNIKDMHFHSAHIWGSRGGYSKRCYILGGIAILLLLLGMFNYINLSTARSTVRAKEVGMRKVLGADRQHIIAQFMGESLILGILACILSAVIVYAVLPLFTEITGHVLWLDFCAPTISGFYRRKLWLVLPGGFHTVRVLSWLQQEMKPLL